MMFILVVLWRKIKVAYILCDENKCFFCIDEENLKKAKMLGMMPTLINNILDSDHQIAEWALKRMNVSTKQELLEKSDREFVGELTTDSLSFKVIKCFCTVAREAS